MHLNVILYAKEKEKCKNKTRNEKKKKTNKITTLRVSTMVETTSSMTL